MSFVGFLIVAFILAVAWSFVNQSRRPHQGPAVAPDKPEVTGVAVLLCHRLADDRTRAQMTNDWAPARADLVAEHWSALGARRYAQVPRLSRWNVVFLLLRVSRSWPVAAIGSLMHGLPVPPLGRNRSEQWDMIEVLEFADVDAASAFMASEAAATLSDEAALWTQHAQAIPMITTRAYLRTHFAPEAAVTLFCLRGRVETGRSGMIGYWLGRHRPFVLGLQPVLNYAWYDQHIAEGAEPLENAVQAQSPGHVAWDGVASIGYEHLRDMVSGLWDLRVQFANIRLVNDETRFLDLMRSALMVGVVTRVIGDQGDA